MPDRAGPRVLVVTDRQRLAEQAGVAPAGWPGLLAAQIRGAIAGGADLVQVREPDLDVSSLVGFLRRLFAELPESRGRVVVNDRADVALVTGAAGVHLGERSLPVGRVRELAGDRRWIIGRSVHDPSGVLEAAGATYLLAGTVRASRSKPPGWRLLGWEGLAKIVQVADKTPVVAIGGLGPADADALRAAGASGVAGIECFLPASGEDVATSVERRVREMRRALADRG